MELLNCVQDAAIPADNTRIVEETVKSIGGIDIIVANARWTRKTQPGDIYDLSYEEWNKVSVPIVRYKFARI